MSRKPTPGARDALLDTATRLFDAHGVHAVGLQQIINECGCGKNLLYREFPSKDELVVAYLKRSQEDWEACVERAIEPYAGDPAAQLVAIVRHSAEKVTLPGARGCALRNTYAEFPDLDHPAHRVARRYFDETRQRILSLAEQANAQDPRELTDRLVLIIDGLCSNGAALGREYAARTAVGLAEGLVRAGTAVRAQAA